MATFIGRTNLIEAEYAASTKTVAVGDVTFAMPGISAEADAPVTLSIRPEDFQMSPVGDSKEGNRIRCRIVDEVFLGLNTHYHVEIPGGQVVEIIHESVMDSHFAIGEDIDLVIKTEKINVFTRDGERNLTHE